MLDIVNHKLVIGGISAAGLADKYGTPLYVYSAEYLKQQFNRLKDIFKYPKLQIYYSCHANANIALMKLLKKEGAYLQVASPMEMMLGFKSGFTSFSVLYHGINLSEEEMRFCADRNIRFSIDNLQMLRKYGERYRGSKVMLRLNPVLRKEAPPVNDEMEQLVNTDELKIAGLVTGDDQKCGILLEELEEADRICQEYHLTVYGLHCHLARKLSDIHWYRKMLKILFDIAGKYQYLDFLDIGGGFDLVDPDDDSLKQMSEFGDAITRDLQSFSDRRKKPVTFAIEPGRFVIAESGYLLTRVSTVRPFYKQTLIGVDTGLHQLNPELAEEAEIINGSNPEGVPQRYLIAGKLTDFHDWVSVKDGKRSTRAVQQISENDVLVFSNVGAYGFVEAANTNQLPRPAEVLIEAGQDRLIRKRETLDDLLRNQLY